MVSLFYLFILFQRLKQGYKDMQKYEKLCAKPSDRAV